MRSPRRAAVPDVLARITVAIVALSAGTGVGGGVVAGAAATGVAAAVGAVPAGAVATAGVGVGAVGTGADVPAPFAAQAPRAMIEKIAAGYVKRCCAIM